MPGPPPKPAGQRLRRNIVPGTIRLPREGYKGPVPTWPMHDGVMTEAEADIWLQLWRKPQAAVWAAMGVERTIARYVRDLILLEHVEAKTTMALANIHSEVRQLEDRLGLNPLAMMRLRWEIVDDEVSELREEKPQRRRLKAVDPDVAAGSG